MADFNLNFGYGGNSNYGQPPSVKTSNNFMSNLGDTSAVAKPFSLPEVSSYKFGENISPTKMGSMNFGSVNSNNSYGGSVVPEMPQLNTVGPALNDSTTNLANAQMDYMNRSIGIAEDSLASQNKLGAWGVGIQAVSAIGNIAMGIKNYHLAKKQFNFEVGVANTNTNNQIAGITNTIKDRSGMANWGSGGDAAKQAWEEDRMKNLSNLKGRIDTEEYRSKQPEQGVA